MYCKNCGAIIPNNALSCEKCGWEVPQNAHVATDGSNESLVASSQASTSSSTAKKKLSIWCWLAIASLCCSAVTLYEGFDKMFNYDSGDSYPYKYVNAYVGGDAYNYIINGTYATAFFVLTAMFVFAAIGLVIIHYLSKPKEE